MATSSYTPAQAAAVYRVKQANGNPYLILGVPQATTDHAVLNTAKRKGALTLHPDKNRHPDAAEAMKLFNEAFEKLTSLPPGQTWTAPPGQGQPTGTSFNTTHAQKTSSTAKPTSAQPPPRPSYKARSAGSKSGPQAGAHNPRSRGPQAASSSFRGRSAFNDFFGPRTPFSAAGTSTQRDWFTYDYFTNAGPFGAGPWGARWQGPGFRSQPQHEAEADNGEDDDDDGDEDDDDDDVVYTGSTRRNKTKSARPNAHPDCDACHQAPQSGVWPHPILAEVFLCRNCRNLPDYATVTKDEAMSQFGLSEEDLRVFAESLPQGSQAVAGWQRNAHTLHGHPLVRIYLRKHIVKVQRTKEETHREMEERLKARLKEAARRKMERQHRSGTNTSTPPQDQNGGIETERDRLKREADARAALFERARLAEEQRRATAEADMAERRRREQMPPPFKAEHPQPASPSSSSWTRAKQEGSRSKAASGTAYSETSSQRAREDRAQTRARQAWEEIEEILVSEINRQQDQARDEHAENTSQKQKQAADEAAAAEVRERAARIRKMSPGQRQRDAFQRLRNDLKAQRAAGTAATASSSRAQTAGGTRFTSSRGNGQRTSPYIVSDDSDEEPNKYQESDSDSEHDFAASPSRGQRPSRPPTSAPSLAGDSTHASRHRAHGTSSFTAAASPASIITISDSDEDFKITSSRTPGMATRLGKQASAEEVSDDDDESFTTAQDAATQQHDLDNAHRRQPNTTYSDTQDHATKETDGGDTTLRQEDGHQPVGISAHLSDTSMESLHNDSADGHTTDPAVQVESVKEPSTPAKARARPTLFEGEADDLLSFSTPSKKAKLDQGPSVAHPSSPSAQSGQLQADDPAKSDRNEASPGQRAGSLPVGVRRGRDATQDQAELHNSEPGQDPVGSGVLHRSKRPKPNPSGEAPLKTPTKPSYELHLGSLHISTDSDPLGTDLAQSLRIDTRPLSFRSPPVKSSSTTAPLRARSVGARSTRSPSRRHAHATTPTRHRTGTSASIPQPFVGLFAPLSTPDEPSELAVQDVEMTPADL